MGFVLLNISIKAIHAEILERFGDNITHQNIKQASRKILYFSSFYQMILIVTFSLLYVLNIFSQHSKISMILLFSVLALRLSSVFQAMRRETNGSILAALLSVIPCLDVWGIIFWSLILF